MVARKGTIEPILDRRVPSQATLAGLDIGARSMKSNRNTKVALANRGNRAYLRVNPDIVDQSQGWRRKGPATNGFGALGGFGALQV